MFEAFGMGLIVGLGFCVTAHRVGYIQGLKKGKEINKKYKKRGR